MGSRDKLFFTKELGEEYESKGRVNMESEVVML